MRFIKEYKKKEKKLQKRRTGGLRMGNKKTGETPQKVTIYDVAKMAGVSTATVSLAIHGDKRIKQETADRIRECIQKLEYNPNYLARGLANRRTYSIGLIVPDLGNPLFSEIVGGAESYLSQHGYHLLIGLTNQNLEKEKFYLTSMLRGGKVDGVILMPTYIEELKGTLQSLLKDNIPFVLSGVPCDGLEVNYVSSNMEEGAFLAVEHLVKKGHTRIAFVSGEVSETQSEQRLAGYKKALALYGLPYRPEYVLHNSQNFDDVRASVTALMTEHPEVTGFFCLYDLIAYATIRAICDSGRSIPGDCAVVGYDNIQLDDYLPITLTSVDANNANMGEIAARLVLNQIENKDKVIPPQHITLTPRLVEREST